MEYRWARKPVHATLFIMLLTVLLMTAQSASGLNSDEHVRNSIVKIYSTASRPDYQTPWALSSPSQLSGSGCVVEGKRILTNAHVVADTTFIEVRLHGQSKRYKARVLKVAHDVDLAFLTVDDESFFSGIKPLEIGDLPAAQQEVLVYGFPIGGDSLSITRGILSRIEHQSYVHSGLEFLAGQIDAAINPGNSGGPVIVNNRIAGVVMQSYGPGISENIGYMVPGIVIEHFLHDIEDGRYDGFPAIGIITQNIGNPDMKRKYHMSDSQTGVIVNHIHVGSPAEDKVMKDDILMKVDGHPVSDSGTVEFRPGERTYYSYYIEMHQVGEEVNLELLRNGKIETVNLRLENKRGDFDLVPGERYDELPRYFIYGGIVFSPLTKNLLKGLGRAWRHRASPEMLLELKDRPTDEKKEVVVVLKVLAAEINKGYHNIRNWIVREVNGKKFKDFNEFYKTVTTSKEPYTVLRNGRGFQIVIDRRKAEESHRKILKTYRIKEDRSPDLFDFKP